VEVNESDWRGSMHNSGARDIHGERPGMCFCLSTCLSLSLSLHVCQSVYLPICLAGWLALWLSVCPSGRAFPGSLNGVVSRLRACCVLQRGRTAPPPNPPPYSYSTPDYLDVCRACCMEDDRHSSRTNLAHKKLPTPLGLLQGPRRRPTVGS